MSRFSSFVWNHGSQILPDKLHIKVLFKKVMGRYPNLDNPTTFNEKVNWMKLYDRTPLYTRLVDKYEAKVWASKIIGEQYIIPTYGVWERFEDIEFDKLPSSFVLKCTHDCGSIVICKNKNTLDLVKQKSYFEKQLRINHYWHAREWAYKDIKPRIIAEKYIEDFNDKELRDYKFYCFNGKPFSLLLATGRQTDHLCFDYFDMDFKHLNLTNHWHPNALTTPHKPTHFEEMKMLAAKLSIGIPQVRVDFYEANENVLFGEMTFYDMGGYLKIHPDDWDAEWGKHIILPR